MANWLPGDQAMCIKAFTERELFDLTENCRYDGPVPTPPLVYDVAEVLPPPIGIMLPAPCYLVLAGLPDDIGFDCRHFRKLNPLPPEDADIPERVPELA